MTSKAQIIERENRFATPAAIAAFGAVLLYVLSIVIEQSTGLKTTGLKTEQLRSFDENSGVLLLATVTRGFGFLLLAAPLLYLFRAAQARSDRVRPEMVGFVFLGPLMLAVQGFVAWIASKNIADEFIRRSARGGDIFNLAQDLIDNDSTRQVASGLLIPAVLGVMVALIYVNLQAVRCGLIPRFWGTLGMALGASMFLIFAVALLAVLIWYVYLGLLILGRTPGGRPPAWAAGEAIPWPRPGEEATEAAGAASGELPAGDGEDTAPEQERPQPRQRGERRKRKRRR